MMYRLGALLLVLAGCAHPNPQLLPRGSGDWMSYNGSLTGERYSPLSEINTGNVPRLQQTCALDTPDTVSFQSGIVAVDGHRPDQFPSSRRKRQAIRA